MQKNILFLIPDAYYYLSAIHNDADHLKNPNDEKSCVYKLNHPVIRNIVKISLTTNLF